MQYTRLANVLCPNQGCNHRWQLDWPGRPVAGGGWWCDTWLRATCPECGEMVDVMFLGWAGEPRP